jgi:hypothetical protein
MNNNDRRTKAMSELTDYKRRAEIYVAKTGEWYGDESVVEWMADFAAQETAHLTRERDEALAKVEAAYTIAKEFRGDVIECSNFIRAKILDFILNDELKREVNRCLNDILSDSNRLDAALGTNATVGNYLGPKNAALSATEQLSAERGEGEGK